MKFFIFALFTASAFTALKAQAHEFHTPNFCHTQVRSFCAHLGYHVEPNSQDAFEFVVDLVAPKAELAAVQSIEVPPLMRMEHGEHGTSPVTIKRLDLNHFQVSDAYLVMKGTWIIQIKVLSSNGSLTLEIPIEVK